MRVRVYWRKVKWGQSLILSDEDDGQEEELGGFIQGDGIAQQDVVPPPVHRGQQRGGHPDGLAGGEDVLEADGPVPAAG